MAKHHHFRTIIALLLAAAGGYYLAYTHYAPELHPAPMTQSALQTKLRKLLAEQVIWTRNYLIAAVAENSDLSPASDRLLINQKDIGYSFIPYYGKEAGQTLAALLREHILLTAEVIALEKAHHKEKLQDGYKRWHDQAKNIALFLSKENPHWDYDALVKMFEAHIALTTEEINSRLHRAWKQDISAFSKVLDQALMMADYFSNGIAQQFPKKF